MKKSNKLRSIFIYFSAFSFVFFPKNAHAFSLVGLNFNFNTTVNVPVSITAASHPQSPVNVTYIETDSDFMLTVATNANFDPERDYRFEIEHDRFWKYNLVFDYANGFFEDESTFALNGTISHGVKPRGSEHDNDRDAGDQFQVLFPSFNLETSLTDSRWTNNRIVFNPLTTPNQVSHQPTHKDRYYTNRLTITRDSSELEELDTFVYVLEGRHESEPVPEPLTTVGSLIALAYGLYFKRKINSFKSKET